MLRHLLVAAVRAERVSTSPFRLLIGILARLLRIQIIGRWSLFDSRRCHCSVRSSRALRDTHSVNRRVTRTASTRPRNPAKILAFSSSETLDRVEYPL